MIHTGNPLAVSSGDEMEGIGQLYGVLGLRSSLDVAHLIADVENDSVTFADDLCAVAGFALRNHPGCRMVRGPEAEVFPMAIDFGFEVGLGVGTL